MTKKRLLDDWNGQPDDYIRRFYKVPAYLNGRITFRGKPGTIVGFTHSGAYLNVRLDGAPEGDDPVTLHPTWEVEYLDGGESR